jgi:xanthosine utilization system XapX-like protein
VVVGITYSLLDITNLIPMDAEIGILVGFMGITYLIALLVNRKRYV